MTQLVYGMTVSLDGYISGPNGEIDWSAPDEELHRFHNERTRAQSAVLMGRKLYQEMLVWEKTDVASWDTEYEREFASIWNDTPKVVFSTTLDRVDGNARLARSDLADEVEALKAEFDGDLSVGGAGLASSLTKLGLIDEYWLFVAPVVLGGGTPYFGVHGTPLDLELLETRPFGQGVIHLRYRRLR